MVEMIISYRCPYCGLGVLESTASEREEHLTACKKGAEHRAAMEYRLGSHSWKGEDYDGGAVDREATRVSR